MFVKVIVVVPLINPLTTPVLDIVATVGLEEIQGLVVAAVVVFTRVIVSPIPTVVVPEITGNGLTVMLKLAVFTAVHKPLVTTAL